MQSGLTLESGSILWHQKIILLVIYFLLLKEKNIETGVHYPKPNHLQPAVIGLFPYIPKLPQTEKAVKEILSLPIHGEMGLDAADKVCDCLLYTSDAADE